MVILILCGTGVLLAYQRQITAWADAMPHVDSAGRPRAPLQEALSAAREGAATEASAIVIRSDPRAPIIIGVYHNLLRRWAEV